MFWTKLVFGVLEWPGSKIMDISYPYWNGPFYSEFTSYDRSCRNSCIIRVLFNILPWKINKPKRRSIRHISFSPLPNWISTTDFCFPSCACVCVTRSKESGQDLQKPLYCRLGHLNTGREALLLGELRVFVFDDSKWLEGRVPFRVSQTDKDWLVSKQLILLDETKEH